MESELDEDEMEEVQKWIDAGLQYHEYFEDKYDLVHKFQDDMEDLLDELEQEWLDANMHFAAGILTGNTNYDQASAGAPGEEELLNYNYDNDGELIEGTEPEEEVSIAAQNSMLH